MVSGGEMLILDPTCSAKSIWFDKENPHVIYCDKRSGQVQYKEMDDRDWIITPDVQCDFTELPFASGIFDMVVFDPPHLMNVGPRLAAKYGKLFANWRDELRSGFDENWRVLKPNGTLIFKWAVNDIPLREVLALAPSQPLFGHTTGSKSQTRWICFIKWVKCEVSR